MTTNGAVDWTTRRHPDNTWSTILEIARVIANQTDRASSLDRMLGVVQELVGCDSAALLRHEGDSLVPAATVGLVPEANSLRFRIAEHPRLAQFMRSREPVRIADMRMPDPFDGLIAGRLPIAHVHACMGCAVMVGDETVGVLAVDALDPHRFDRLEDEQFAALAALAAAAMRTADLLAKLESDAARADDVARLLVRSSSTRTGRELLGQSAPIAVLREEIALAARSDLAILIVGETGVGKELVAQSIHVASARSDSPLIYVNCAALPESIAESELFGHVRGAFTGALDHRAGKFEVAHGGTLFLDEIGELPLSIQPKLLRALQSGEIQRVGSDKLLRVDVRIIAATNRDLPGEVSAGRFRADLYHRLSVYPIRVPPLRERGADITLLAGYFLDESRMRLGLGRVRLAPDARRALELGDWPGNVRELEHAILRAALRASGGRRRELVVIEAAHLDVSSMARPCLPQPKPVDPAPHESLRAALDAFCRERIHAAVEASGGNWAEAARHLRLDRGNLHRLARRLGM